MEYEMYTAKTLIDWAVAQVTRETAVKDGKYTAQLRLLSTLTTDSGIVLEACQTLLNRFNDTGNSDYRARYMAISNAVRRATDPKQQDKLRKELDKMIQKADALAATGLEVKAPSIDWTALSEFGHCSVAFPKTSEAQTAHFQPVKKADPDAPPADKDVEKAKEVLHKAGITTIAAADAQAQADAAKLATAEAEAERQRADKVTRAADKFQSEADALKRAVKLAGYRFDSKTGELVKLRQRVRKAA